VVRGAPEALIKQNVFHLQLKLQLGQRNQEITTLREASASQKKEFDDLKARYETLEKTHKHVISIGSESL
jgi:cell division protein FtsL